MIEVTTIISLSVLSGAFLWVLFEYKASIEELNKSRDWEKFYRKSYFSMRDALIKAKKELDYIKKEVDKLRSEESQ